MDYILDTHALIWFLNGDNKLFKPARDNIENQNYLKTVSVASIWEIAIKISLGKFKFEKGFRKFLQLVVDNGFEIIPIRFEHAMIVSNLEFIHRDPFDRLIIAQAISNNFTIIIKDENIIKYDVITLW